MCITIVIVIIAELSTASARTSAARLHGGHSQVQLCIYI